MKKSDQTITTINNNETISDAHNILSKSQFGYRTNKSTAAALLNSMHNTNFTVNLFFDLQKGFDCVNQHFLLNIT